ncbi:MAG: hypothetical protein LUP97_09215 [Methanoregula sp.]|nr:hypothetical protein [Methanoregula sp.]
MPPATQVRIEQPLLPPIRPVSTEVRSLLARIRLVPGEVTWYRNSGFRIPAPGRSPIREMFTGIKNRRNERRS